MITSILVFIILAVIVKTVIIIENKDGKRKVLIKVMK
jgi:hypothetical protein